MWFDVLLFAYLIDILVGEFRFIRHPVQIMGDYISWFEQHFYKNTVQRGIILNISLLCLVGALSYTLTLISSHPLFLGIVASMGIASKMLYDSVLDIIDTPDNIQFLVSRDTENLSPSDINKAAIETYAENLSDGVIAPLLYLACFGLVGLFVYKAINTLDSMVAYKNERYQHFGYFSAHLDDIANFIPARITAMLIAFFMYSLTALKLAFKHGKLHASPNAGYPIAAMAGACHVSLGGPTSYFGQMVNKPYFGIGRKNITTSDILTALKFKKRFDIFILFCCVIYIASSLI